MLRKGKCMNLPGAKRDALHADVFLGAAFTVKRWQEL